MARLTFSLNSPTAGLIVGRKIAVSGRVRTEGVGTFPIINFTGVRVRFGVGGPEQPAPVTGISWSCVGSPSPTVTGGATVKIPATASGTSQQNVGTAAEPEPGPTFCWLVPE